MGRIDAENRAQYVTALRERLLQLEHDIYFNDAAFAANPQSATVGDVEMVRMRHLEAEAIRAAIAEMDGERERAIPLWLHLALAMMVGVAIVLAGVALWTH